MNRNSKLQTHNNNNNNNKSQSIINVQIYLLHFLYFWGLSFVFSSFRDIFVSGMGRRKVNKIL